MIKYYIKVDDMKIDVKTISLIENIDIEFDTSFKVTLSSLGASIYKINYYGKDMNIYPRDKNDFIKGNIYHGKTIGRLANRVKDSILKINNQYYYLASNENKNCLHGGYFGLHTDNFKSQINKIDASHIQVKYFYKSYDLESGFPGLLDCNVIYDIYDSGEINISYDFISNKDTALNITNHTCFCLGEETNSDIDITFRGTRYIDVNKKDLTPLKYCDLNDVFDFSNTKSITKDINASILKNEKQVGYDNHIELEKNENGIIQIDLQSNNFHLCITSNQSGIQLYSDNMFENIVTNSKYNRRRGVNIECQDSLLEDHFIKANQHYQRFINYKFSYKDKE